MKVSSKDLCDRLRIVAGQSVIKAPAIDIEAADHIERLEVELARALKEAAIAWNLCASIHLKYAKGKDAVFTTRQNDYLRHAANANDKATEK